MVHQNFQPVYISKTTHTSQKYTCTGKYSHIVLFSLSLCMGNKVTVVMYVHYPLNTPTFPAPIFAKKLQRNGSVDRVTAL